MCEYRFLLRPKKYKVWLLTSEQQHTCRVLSAISKTPLSQKFFEEGTDEQNICQIRKYPAIATSAQHPSIYSSRRLQSTLGSVVKLRVLSASLFSEGCETRRALSLKSQSINVPITFDDYAGADTFEAFSLKNRSTSIKIPWKEPLSLAERYKEKDFSSICVAERVKCQ